MAGHWQSDADGAGVNGIVGLESAKNFQMPNWGCFNLRGPKEDLETRPWVQVVYLKGGPRKHKWSSVESETKKGEEPTQSV